MCVFFYTINSEKICIYFLLILIQDHLAKCKAQVIQYWSFNKIGEILVRVKVIMLNATFNNISVIPWWLVLLVEEIEVPRENN